MSQAQATALNNQVEEVAIRAVYQLQYNTNKAARFVVGEVPAASFELALETINRVVRTSPQAKKAK